MSERLPSGQAIEHYEIIRQLGRGGMGRVYLARDTRLGRLVAIKLLIKRGQRAAERLLIEARATARCKHENIVIVYEVGEHEGAPYLALEYVEGSTLRTWLDARARPQGVDEPEAATPRPLPPTRAVELMVPVVRALAYAHAQGVVHRDLKPENVLLSDAGRVKVVDFGIATQIGPDAASRLASEGRHVDEGLRGTYLYMAPEQWRGEAVDHRADLWALGLMLYELCAGVHPLAPVTEARLAQVADPSEPMPSLLGRCPDAPALAALVDRCLRKRRGERFGSADELLAALEALSPGRRAPALADDQSPFAGLSAFQEGDAGRFFGRESEIASALGRLRNQPLLAVAGPSGAGKSSFVRAGVLPALKRAHPMFEALIVRPGRSPLAALAESLSPLGEHGGARADAPNVEGLVAILRTQPGYLGTRLRAHCRRDGGRQHLALFVDQFEELYTLGAEPAERAAFLACLAGVADDASSPLRLLLGLRSDFLDRVADNPPFAAELTRGLFLLSPLGTEGLRRALTRPLEASGYRFESDALIDLMLEALGTTRSPLPLLQFTAARLWEARDRERKLLTRESYEQLGGVAGALSAHADATLAALAPPERRLGREVLLRLVSPERTRAVVELGELRALATDPDAVERVVGRFADARLVLVEPSAEPGGASVELVHESLIERWPALRRWLDESEHDALFVARLRAAAQQWAADGEAEGLLWRDRAADEARAWLGRRRDERGEGATAGLGPRDGRFLRAVIDLAERARRRRRRAAAGAFATLGAFATVVSLLAVRAGREAALARAEAERADREAARARNVTRLTKARELSPDDPTTALALLREVEPPSLPREWADLTFQTLHAGVSRAVFLQPDVLRSVAFSPDGRRIAVALNDRTARVFNADGTGAHLVLRGHDDELRSASFSPDGRRIVTGSKDGTVRIWPAEGRGEPIVLRGHEHTVLSTAFSPDGRRVISASRDGTARIWSADGMGEPLVLRGHKSSVYSATFSPDGRRIATASRDGTLRVWSETGASEPLALQGHENSIYSAAFSPDGQRIVTTSEDKTVRVWRADGAGGPLVLRGHESSVYSAAFSPDGRRIVSASADKTLRVWNADGTGEPLVLRGHGSSVVSAAFSPDGGRIATVSDDRTARVWDTHGGGRPLVLSGHEGAVADVAFSPDGERIASASTDKTVRVWRADGTGEPIVLRGHDGEVVSVSFGPEGRHVVTASRDGTARVFRADGSGEALVLRGHSDQVFAAAISPDGRQIATVSRDRALRIFNADGAGEPLVLQGHDGDVTSVKFSPDGLRVITGSADKTARIWNVDGSGTPLVLSGHEGTLYSAAFSPDGRSILTGAYDKTARIWPAGGKGEPIVLRGHSEAVSTAAWGPDGRRVITASADKTTRIWNADGTGEPIVLRGHGGMVISAAFSPDGRRVVTASEDKTLQIWDTPAPLLGLDDPQLWAATSYCLPVGRRVELLNLVEAAAEADRQACEHRIDTARRLAPSR